MCVGLNIYIDDNLMFTELSSRERVSVCENMHLSDNLHFTDSRRRTSMYLLGVNHLFLVENADSHFLSVCVNRAIVFCITIVYQAQVLHIIYCFALKRPFPLKTFY